MKHTFATPLLLLLLLLVTGLSTSCICETSISEKLWHAGELHAYPEKLQQKHANNGRYPLWNCAGEVPCDVYRIGTAYYARVEVIYLPQHYPWISSYDDFDNHYYFYGEPKQAAQTWYCRWDYDETLPEPHDRNAKLLLTAKEAEGLHPRKIHGKQCNLPLNFREIPAKESNLRYYLLPLTAVGAILDGVTNAGALASYILCAPFGGW